MDRIAAVLGPAAFFLGRFGFGLGVSESLLSSSGSTLFFPFVFKVFVVCTTMVDAAVDAISELVEGTQEGCIRLYDIWKKKPETHLENTCSIYLIALEWLSS